MHLDWANFTPYASLVGGLLIGSAAVLLLLLRGRIMGISGILGATLQALPAEERHWRLAFLLGIFCAPLIWQLFYPLPALTFSTQPVLLILAGLLVGFGSRLGSGCTSGHGICGLSRFSKRSAVATALFMSSGFATVFIARHVLN